MACLLLVSSPLAVAWGMGLYDRVEVGRVRHALRRTTDLLAAEARRRGPNALAGGPTEWLHTFGRRHDVLIRVLDEEGRVVAATDATFADGRISRRWWFRRAADYFFGPEGPPDLIAYEAEIGPESERAEVMKALASGLPAERVREPPAANMFAFYRVVPIEGTGRLLYVTRVSRRSARALYDLRFQLLKLTLGLLIGAAAMGLWLVWTVVQPLRRLQRRVHSSIRAGGARDLSLERNDEIGDLARDFDKLARRLNDRLEQTAQVTADFAHDLKNPIAAVIATAEMLETNEEISEDRRHRLARAAHQAARHMRRSVDAMLELARLDEALPKEERGRVDLAAVAGRVVARRAERPRAKALSFEHDLSPSAVEGVEMRLTQLIENLLDNAEVFASSRILVRVRGEGDEVLIEISDDGDGVAEGNRDKIFERFFTARPEGVEPGSGLGLAIVSAIAEAHGGGAELATEGPLPGATFRVRLPRI